MAYDPKAYTHPSDKAALAALTAIPGFTPLLKGYMKVWSERQFRVLNMSSRVRIDGRQMTKYYEMLPPICDRLGIAVPEMYMEMDMTPNAYTYGDTNPFIVITSGLLRAVPEDLLPTVLAHECGHIACRHVLYRTMGSLILGGAEGGLSSLPFGQLISLPLQVAFYYWMRCSEYSADRAAVLCDGGAEKMSDVCMRLAGFDRDLSVQPDKEAFMNQAREYREMVRGNKWDRTMEFLILRSASHPFSAVRALECTEWAASPEFRALTGAPAAPSEQAAGKPSAAAEQLGGMYRRLLEKGVISREEYEARMKKLRGGDTEGA